MKLDGLALDENGFKSLNSQPVQGRCTVEQNRMFTDYLVQNIPDFIRFPFHQFLGLFNGSGKLLFLQLGENERLEEFLGHFLGQATLVQFQFRTCDNDRTSGKVDPFAKQVLPEPSLFSLEHVTQ